MSLRIFFSSEYMNFQSFSNLEFVLDFCQIYAGIVWLLEWCMHEPSTALLLTFFPL
jgi:hypothetical protein